ncbi:MAG: AbiV family abortive infection protein [Tildeniella torsiva UHER 1998/13D]|jgi:AbiV family abortive infection protein|nr:AbiV family abortive infection protein [Tildeniella torsiva UHER 1998/13D]
MSKKGKGKFDYSSLDYDLLFELGQEVYSNAYSLLTDACILFAFGSHSTAYALAVLSLEECGKFQGLDHVSMELELNSGLNNNFKEYFLPKLFSGKQFYNHSWKQKYASFSVGDHSDFPGIHSEIMDGSLDIAKQQALYVGLESGVIGTPSRFTPERALKMIRYAFEAFKEIEDLPFYQVFEDSSEETKSMASSSANDIKDLINSLPEVSKEIFASDIICFVGRILKIYEASVDDS